jgi:hypothetical protein
MEATSADVSPAPALVAALSYKPGWSFKAGGPEGRFLCVFARTPDSMRPGCERTTQHMFKFPAPAMERREFARWAFECLLKAELHEAGEFFTMAGHRPFFPHHQDEGDPYERVERWP